MNAGSAARELAAPEAGRGRGAERLEFADALRGWAVLGVLAVHAGMWVGELPPLMAKLTAHGARGVQLFYVVSAFTIFLSLARRSGRETRPARNFFIRRFFRIAPMFYVAMAIFLFKKGPSVDGIERGAGAVEVAATALFLNGWSPYWINNLVFGQWSVAVEMMFYLTAPLLARWVTDLRRAAGLAVLCLAGPVLVNRAMIAWSPIADRELWANFLFMWLPSQAPIFALGITLYYLWLKVESGEIPRRRSGLVMGAALSACTLAIGVDLPYLRSYWLFGIAFVLLALGLALRPNRFWVNPAMRSLGKVSYSFYLTHGLVLPLVIAVLNRLYRMGGITTTAVERYAALMVVGGLATYAVSRVCFRLVEKPGMDAGRRLIERLERR